MHKRKNVGWTRRRAIVAGIVAKFREYGPDNGTVRYQFKGKDQTTRERARAIRV